MRIIKRQTLKAYWERSRRTEQPLKAWLGEVRAADWQTSQGVLQSFPKAKVLNASRVRFPILGGSYRLIAEINYGSGVVFIRFIGTHDDYDKVDALTVKDY